ARSEEFERSQCVFAGVASDLQLTVGRRHVLFLEDLQQGAGGAGACGASGVGVDAYADQPFGLWLAVLGATGQGCCHELGPDRQGGSAAVFPSTQWSGLVETDPDGGDVVAVVAGEPAVLLIVGGTGLAGKVAARTEPVPWVRNHLLCGPLSPSTRQRLVRRRLPRAGLTVDQDQPLSLSAFRHPAEAVELAGVLVRVVVFDVNPFVWVHPPGL